MFQTDLIHYLQLADSEILTYFMSFISLLGTTPAILVFVLAVTFAFDFKRGVVLINIVAWTSILTILIKQQIDYPRPIDVDSSIKTVYLKSNGKNFKEILPSSFFSLIPAKILNETRNDDFHHFGFPSGHVSIQFALWFTLFFLFRKKWIKRVGIFMILMTMISRMYLGHHFLGDILGGALLGIMVSLAILFLVQRSAYLTELAHQYYSLSILWLPIVLIPFANYLPVWILSSLIGLNLATAIIILQKNFPVFHIIAWKRVVAAFISLLFIITVFYMGKQLIYSENGFFKSADQFFVKFCDHFRSNHSK